MEALCSAALTGFWAGHWPWQCSAGLRFRHGSRLVSLHLQVSHWDVQPNTPFRDIDAAAKFTGVAPARWLLKARVSEQGLAARLLAMNIHAKNMLLQISKQQSFSCTTLCFALPEAIHLLFDCRMAWLVPLQNKDGN
uniref:Uncharacterized protein n=1 Tax=Otus sunia TaxID=257818 RepID=A0A8C8AT37_9STRI